MSSTLDDVSTTLQDDPHAAFQQLRELMAFPGQLESSSQWGRAFGLFLQIGRALGDESELAGNLQQGARTPDDVQTLYDIGYQLIEQRLFGLSAGVLARANELAPGQPGIINELVYALEQSMLNAAAVGVLRAHPELSSEASMTRYLLAFHSIMTGDVQTARELYPALLSSGDEDLMYMGGTIEGMVCRADAIAAASALDDRDIRGWHFVVNGALLLHVSPHGLQDPMRGRYAWVQDSASIILEGIRKLDIALAALGSKPERVFSLPERGSQIVARAAATILAVPVVEWTPGTEASGLIAAYDLDHLDGDTLGSIADHRPGQMVWAHAACWTQGPPFCPDLVTMLYQHNTAPWAEQLTVDANTQEATTTAVSIAPPEHHAEQIVKATLEDEQLVDTEELRALVTRLADAEGLALPNALQSEGRRGRQWLGSPVPSARFT